MSFFGCGKSYSRDDLDKGVAKLRELYVKTMSSNSPQLKRDLAAQLQDVLEVCRKGGFNGSEMVEWPTLGSYTSLRNVTPAIQVLLELM